jgi:uncharacterized membrane protein
MMEAKLI